MQIGISVITLILDSIDWSIRDQICSQTLKRLFYVWRTLYIELIFVYHLPTKVLKSLGTKTSNQLRGLGLNHTVPFLYQYRFPLQLLKPPLLLDQSLDLLSVHSPQHNLIFFDFNRPRYLIDMLLEILFIFTCVEQTFCFVKYRIVTVSARRVKGILAWKLVPLKSTQWGRID